MEQRSRSRKKLIFWWAVISGVLPGTVLGIWMGQNHWIGLVAILGWFYLPAEIYKIVTQVQFPSNPIERLQFFATLTYPLAFIFYLVCGYAVTRITGFIQHGLYSALLAAGFTALASIIPDALTMMIVQGVSFTPVFLGDYTSASAEFSLIILLPLIALAAIAGYIGARAGRRRSAPLPANLAPRDS
jgi:hypothetical protein